MVRDGNVSLNYAQLAINALCVPVTHSIVVHIHCALSLVTSVRKSSLERHHKIIFGLLAKTFCRPDRASEAAKDRSVSLEDLAARWTMKQTSCLLDNSRYQQPL